MVEILKEGRLSMAKMFCEGCETSLSFNQYDVKMEKDKTPYIICPECNKGIRLNAKSFPLQWKWKKKTRKGKGESK